MKTNTKKKKNRNHLFHMKNLLDLVDKIEIIYMQSRGKITLNQEVNSNQV